ncbi:alpha/beta fold hydrolase [Facilibium subflavum]|uniref:alpha/beta fold hydrolase n=1 Tax=Facilibium subflavum TaxID=2219058 RepID=UPI000E65E5C4|nr:alpha/beta hydrolase [Facilibium subflavum]
MPFITANQVNLYYEQHGQGEDIILISGLSADHNAWALLMPQLTKSHRVTVFDNRGAGQSALPDGNYTISQMVEDTGALMNQLNIQSAHIIGHSMGGMIAQQLALTYPDKVKSVCIVCSRASPYTRGSYWLELSYKMLAQEVSLSVIIEYGFSYLFSNQFISNAENLKLWRELLLSTEYPQTLKGYQYQLNAVKNYNALDSLSGITQRTLIVAGEDDILTPLTLSKKMQAVILNAELTTLPSGHMPNIECPALLAKIIIDWVKNSEKTKQENVKTI